MFWNNKKSGKYNSGWWLVLTRVKSDIIRGVYTPLFFMDPQLQEMQQLLQIYIRRLNEETSKSIAFEARIVQLINQINSMQPEGKDAGNFAAPKKNVGRGKTAK